MKKYRKKLIREKNGYCNLPKIAYRYNRRRNLQLLR